MTIAGILLVAVPAVFLFIFLLKVFNWLYLTLWTPKELDLSDYGGCRPHGTLSLPSNRTPKSWAVITGASDGIGAAFAKVAWCINCNSYPI